MNRIFVLCVVATVGITSAARAQISYPMLMDANPLAVQVGTTTEVEITARYNLYGAYNVMISGTGVTAELPPPPEPKQPEAKLEVAKKDEAKKADKPADAKKEVAKKDDGKKPDAKQDAAKKEEPKKDDKAAAAAMPVKKPESPKLKLKFTVAKDAQLGVREFRIATPQGASTIGQLVIVRDPVTVEKNPNDALAEATPVKLPATICGAIEKAEDVDHFKFHAKAGQALVFHVRSARCEDKIHDLQQHVDPIISLKNATGTVLAMSDNYFFADPLLHYQFAAAGEYFLEIRDVRFQGNAFWQYAVEVNDRPFVTNVHPLGLAPEQPTKVELIGFNLPAGATATLTAPGNSAEGSAWLEVPIAPPTSLAPVVISKLPQVVEAGGNNEPDKAQTFTFPAGVSGRLAATGEIDYYAFDAKKGDKFNFEVLARRHQSGADPILAILNDKGARLLEQDDATEGWLASADAAIDNWAAPADGRYTLEVRDLHLEGGPQHVYFLKAQRAEPYFTLQLDSDKTNLAPGIGGAIYVRVFRKSGFTGEVQLSAEGLPEGVDATCGRILDGANDGCIVLTARPDAKVGVSNIRVRGTAEMTVDGKPRKLTDGSQPLQETYFPGGGRGLFPVETHTVAVNEPLDIRGIKLSTTEINLQPGGSQKIEVTIERAEGFDKNVTLDVMYKHLGGVSGNSLPAGVTLDDKLSKTLLTGKVSQGVIVLNAAPDAKPVTKQVVPVIANVAINFVMKMSYVGPPLSVTLSEKPK